MSALTLGGGGIGGVWGSTTRAEAVATVREAVERGITLFDLAPSYGDGEAERVVGEAFGNVDLPSDVRLTTKHQLGASPVDVYPRLRASLEASLTRMGREHVDVFFLHGMIIPDSWAGSRGTPRSLFGKEVRPAFERLVSPGSASRRPCSKRLPKTRLQPQSSASRISSTLRVGCIAMRMRKSRARVS